MSSVLLKPNKSFCRWLDTYIDESKLNRDQLIDFEDNKGYNHIMELGILIDRIKKLKSSDQLKIKKTIVFIDFQAENVLHYLQSLAGSLFQLN